MKKLHSILPIMVVAIMLILFPVIQAEAAEGKPGQNISVTFSFNEIRGLDGVFTFSNEAILENISYSSTFSGVRFNGNKVFYSTTNEGATAGTITVSATIKGDAAVGSSCTITLGDINITDANTNSVYSGSKSEVVSVVKEPVVTKAPVNPTATPASQSGGQSSNQNNSQNQNSNNTNNQNQNVVDNSSNVQNSNKTPTEAPAQNNVDNNKTNTSSSKSTEAPAASSSPEASAEATEEPAGHDENPSDSIEANTGVSKGDDKSEKKGGNIWLILFLISLLINLLVAGLLLWKNFRNKAEDTIVKDDTPIVDYDIDEDFDDDII